MMPRAHTSTPVSQAAMLAGSTFPLATSSTFGSATTCTSQRHRCALTA